jgi:ABC-type bacteriocin/lantibiotic exporter with double-glycine peptidase domain
MPTASTASAAVIGLPFIWQVLGPFRRRAALVGGLVLLDTALAAVGVGVILPVFQALLNPTHTSAVLTATAPIFDELTPSVRLTTLAVATIMLFMLKAAVSMLAVAATQRFVQDLRFDWMSRIGDSYLRGPHTRLAARKQGELLNDWFNEPWAAARFFQGIIACFASAALTLTLLVISLLVNWQATLVLSMLGAVLMLGGGAKLYGGAARLSKSKIETNQALTSCMVEDLSSVREIKLMLAEDIRLGQFRQFCDRLKSIVIRGTVWGEIPRIAGEFLAVAVLMCLVVFAVMWWNISPQELLPLMAFFFVAFYRLMAAATLFMSSRVKALNEIFSVRRVHQIASEPFVREDREHGLDIATIETDIKFEAVSFSYSRDRHALAMVDACIPRGRLTYLVGPSGAGKSTLLDILLRLVAPSSGCIIVNGTHADEFNIAQWRRCFGYVSQDAILFNGSIRMNLLLSRPRASEEEIARACHLAGVDEFINNMPQRYDTVVGDRGHTVSGGQRKRIAIARALISNPQVLILDEATTSFEQSLEREILIRLKQQLAGLTIIQVTHRLEAAAEADWIIAMDKGSVAAMGTWQDVQARVRPMREALLG